MVGGGQEKVPGESQEREPGSENMSQKWPKHVAMQKVFKP